MSDISFKYKDYIYTIIDRNQRHVRVGTGLDSGDIPNAVSDKSSIFHISIPSYVIYNDEAYLVIEIGLKSFQYCQNCTSIFIPFTIEIFRQQCFYRCIKVTNLIFEDHSRLKKIETFACYDFYELQELKFTGNLLKYIGSHSFQYSHKCLSVVIPASVTFIDGWAFHGCKGMQEFIYCGSSALTADVFGRGEPHQAATPQDIMKVTPNYPLTTIGPSDNVIVDDTIDTSMMRSLARFYVDKITCRANYGHLNFNLIAVIIIL